MYSCLIGLESCTQSDILPSFTAICIHGLFYTNEFYETRHNKLYLTHVNTRSGRRILRFKGSQLWNQLPNDLSQITTPRLIQKKLIMFRILNLM